MSEITYLGEWDDSPPEPDVPAEPLKPSAFCVVCGEVVNPNENGTYREVRGWAKVRGPGGTNSVAMKQETGALMCPPCGERRRMQFKAGIDPEQQSLI